MKAIKSKKMRKFYGSTVGKRLLNTWSKQSQSNPKKQTHQRTKKTKKKHKLKLSLNQCMGTK